MLEEESRPIPESMLHSSSLASIPRPSIPRACIPLSPSMLSSSCRLLPTPTHRRSLAFKLDLPALLSFSLLAKRSSNVALRFGFWGSTRVNTGILKHSVPVQWLWKRRKTSRRRDSSPEGGPGTWVSLKRPRASLFLELQGAQVCITVDLNSRVIKVSAAAHLLHFVLKN